VSEVITKRTVLFFVGYVLVVTVMTSLLVGYLENGPELNNPVFVLGSGVLTTLLFHWMTQGSRK